MEAEYFCIQEYVPPHVYEARGEKAWQLIDDRLITVNDLLRKEFGPMIINTWHSDKLQAAYKLRQWSGLRDIEYYRKPWMTSEKLIEEFAKHWSQHIYGRASDSIFRDADAEEVRRAIMKNPYRYGNINAIEKNVSWLHGDVRNYGNVECNSTLLIFSS